jgi:hypothetical protein
VRLTLVIVSLLNSSVRSSPHVCIVPFPSDLVPLLSSYIVDSLEAISVRARYSDLQIGFELDEDPLRYPYVNQAAKNVEKAIVFVSAFQEEGGDRKDLSLLHGGDELIAQVAAYCNDGELNSLPFSLRAYDPLTDSFLSLYSYRRDPIRPDRRHGELGTLRSSHLAPWYLLAHLPLFTT